MSLEQPPLSLATVVSATANQVHARVGDDRRHPRPRQLPLLFAQSGGRPRFRAAPAADAFDAVADTIVAEFEVDAPTARRDLLALVDTLVAQKLVEARANGAV